MDIDSNSPITTSDQSLNINNNDSSNAPVDSITYPQPSPILQPASSQTIPSDDIFSNNQEIPQPDGKLYPLNQSTTPAESASSEIIKGSLDLINAPRLLELETGLFQGKEAEQQQIKNQNDLMDVVNKKITNLPVDQKSWATSWAPKMFGEAVSPILNAGVGLAELGVSSILPEATAASEESALTVASVAKKALRYGLSGVAAGTVIGSVNQAINAGTPQEKSLPDFITNSLEWGAYGLGEGVVRGISPLVKPYINDAIKTVKGKFVKTDLDSTITPPVSRETVAAAQDTNIVKSVNGKVADSTTSIQASYNETKDAYQNEQNDYDNQNQDYQDNTLSPNDRYEASILAHKNAKLSKENEIEEIINNISNEYNNDDNNIKSALSNVPLNDLINARQSLKLLDGLSTNKYSNLSNIINNIDSVIPTSGVARKINYLKNKDYLNDEDKEYIRSSYSPNFELNEMEKSNDLSDKNIEKYELRKKGLNDLIINNNKNSMHDHINNLNNHVKNLDDINTDLRQVVANHNLSSSDKFNVQSAAEKDYSDITNPNQDMVHDHDMSMQDMAAKKTPYQNHISTINELDDQVSKYKESGYLLPEEEEIIKQVDEENNHDGIGKIFQQGINCIFENR